jgi:hypothetical protein
MSIAALHRIGAVVLAASLVSAPRGAPHSTRPRAHPETVMVTYHVKRGSEAELARVLASHWDTALRLQLVDSAPHVIVKSSDASQPTDVVEIFTWRDAATPDHAPPEIQAAWSRMAPLVESRGNRPAVEPLEVSIVR